METRHTLTNSSQGVYQVAQVVRVAAPSLHTSGPYTCKVATFTTEMTDTHTLLIFGEFSVAQVAKSVKIVETLGSLKLIREKFLVAVL